MKIRSEGILKTPMLYLIMSKTKEEREKTFASGKEASKNKRNSQKL